MAEITLRAYLAEIGDLIDHSFLDEAVAHCRQILTYFPKDLDALRLLGKAYLELGRHGDAADILERVLSAVPDDFVSHVGMGIIREDEGNLDSALYHMERAFEINPSNAVVQQELRRLYGRRDGLEPARIHLTRGALARMYVNGELFPQAVAELRACLSENPDRPDLQALLAEVYWRAEQQMEAAETCNELLTRLPYCRKANRILADIWESSGRPEEASVYRKRLEALDPYEAYANGTSQSGANESAVRLQKLVYDARPSLTGGSGDQPGWATSLGVELERPASPPFEAGALPDWLREPSPTEGAVSAESATEVTAWLTGLVAQADEPEVLTEQMIQNAEIPEWLQGGDQAATAPDITGDPSAGLPDWLQAETDREAAMKKHGPRELPGEPVARSETESEAAPEGEGTPTAGQTVEMPNLEKASIGLDWLESLAQDEPALESPVVREQEALPDWLRDLGSEPAAEEITAPAVPEFEAEARFEPVPDWLAESGPEPAAETIAPDTPALQAETRIEAAPDWLAELAQEPSPEQTASPAAPKLEAQTGVDGAPVTSVAPAESGADLAWLEALAAPQSTVEGISDSGFAQWGEDVPDWVARMAAETPLDATQDYAVPEPEALAGVPAQDADAAVAWLEDLLAPEQDGPLDKLKTDRLMQDSAIPDWIPGTVLSRARARANAADLTGALNDYAILIKASAGLDQVISDLEEGSQRHAAEPRWLRTLGDAYMKDNQLQKALEAFRKALDTI